MEGYLIMLIFYSEDLTITGYQAFPETSKAPHIVVSDDMAEQLNPVIGYAKLTDNDGILQLPDDLSAIAAEKVNAVLAESVRAERDSLLRELDAVVNNPLRWASLSQEQQSYAAEYRQALLNVPQQEGFPTEVVWPIRKFYVDKVG